MLDNNMLSIHLIQLRLKLKGPTDTPLKEAPGSAKHLLSSGLLEGHHVRYLGRGGLVSS